tara:strand:- start:529 stop:1143 length:615 start_codon:yes stop_codon:yes gene_type:complete
LTRERSNRGTSLQRLLESERAEDDAMNESLSSMARTQHQHIYGSQAMECFLEKYRNITRNETRSARVEEDIVPQNLDVESDEETNEEVGRKRKRKAFRENSVSKFTPYFEDAGRNKKGNPLMKCLLRPSRGGPHPEIFCCSHTGHMSAHMTTWHLPALVKLKEMNTAGMMSRQKIINCILSSYGVRSAGMLIVKIFMKEYISTY